MKNPKTAKISSVRYTAEMGKAIDDYRVANLLTWEAFFKKARISGRPILAYWEKTGRISFNQIRNFKLIGLDLFPYIKRKNG